MNREQLRIAVIGLGYVGLPLAVEFGHHFPTLGFDISQARVDELNAGEDKTNEVTPEALSASPKLGFTASAQALDNSNFYVVCVPTPIDQHKQPDLSLMKKASETVGTVLKAGDYVVYESTVYPGATEEVCVPILESVSGLTFNQDFFVGYSPERINPGDKEHSVTDIVKVTSGSTPAAAETIDAVYRDIIRAGTHKASSIKVAEAAKVIENTQRDLNIALMNELALIFSRLDINTQEVLDAAGTKWNFLPFRPGLVGGHCIGVDPYYLTQKALSVGYHPEVILAGRRINDYMANHVGKQMILAMTRKRIQIVDARILVLGLTFKENCPDIRNTKVIDLIRKLESFGTIVDCFDPWADHAEVLEEYGIQLLTEWPQREYDGVVSAVAHKQFAALSAQDIQKVAKEQSVVFDVKGNLPASVTDLTL